MERLHFLLGQWRYVNEYAGGGQDSGSYSAQLGPGGHSLLTDFEGQGAMGQFAAHEVFTWNPAENRYEAYAFASPAPGCSVRYGNWEGDTLVFTRSLGGQEFRYVYKQPDKNSLTIELYVRRGEQPFTLLLTTRATKADSH